MTGYQQCILRYSACMCGDRFTIRNIDRWYIDSVSDLFSTHPFLQHRNDGKRDFWCIKSSKPVFVPSLDDISDWNGFIRCFMELRGSVDLWKHKNRGGILLTTPRLRLYGQPDDLTAVMAHIPAGVKKIQYVSTQTGKTCMVSFQSPAEVREILHFIDGDPRNAVIWEKWHSVLVSGDQEVLPHGKR